MSSGRRPAREKALSNSERPARHRANRATVEALEAIVYLDLADLTECESPREYGRD